MPCWTSSPVSYRCVRRDVSRPVERQQRTRFRRLGECLPPARQPRKPRFPRQSTNATFPLRRGLWRSELLLAISSFDWRNYWRRSEIAAMNALPAIASTWPAYVARPERRGVAAARHVRFWRSGTSVRYVRTCLTDAHLTKHMGASAVQHQGAGALRPAGVYALAWLRRRV